MRLLVLAPSHYCEKARWALQRAGLPFEEEVHLPLFHAFANRKLKVGRTVPVLATSEGTFDDSTAILHFIDTKVPTHQRLFPDDPALRKEIEELEALFDDKLGPHTRRYAYFHLLPIKSLVLQAFSYRAPKNEFRFFKLFFPLIRAAMRQGMKINPASAERSKAIVDQLFADISKRLQDGRRYLVGDRFSAADLTFASLGAPVVLPPEYGTPLPSISDLPAALQPQIHAYRQSPAGLFILRLYREERSLQGSSAIP